MGTRPAQQPKPRVGRPRAFDDEGEQELLLDAAYRIMARGGFDRLTIADVLAEAGLSTRAFYRHFASKGELVLAVFRRDGARVASRIEQRVRRAAHPVEALRAWIDESLAITYESGRAARVGVLAATSVRRAVGYEKEEQRWIDTVLEPLRDVLERGRRDGSMPSADPEHDVVSIFWLTWSSAGSSLTGNTHLDRQRAVEHVERFCHPALGIPHTD